MALTRRQFRLSTGLSRHEFRARYAHVNIPRADRPELGKAGPGRHWTEFVNRETGEKSFVTVLNAPHGGLFHHLVREFEHLHNPKRVTRGIAKQLVYVNRVGGAVVSAAGGYFGG